MTYSNDDNPSALLDDRFPLPLDRPFTTGQGATAGLTANTLTRLTSRGLLRRMIRGVYVAAQAQDCLLLRANALLLVVPPGTVVTDRTAGWLHGGNVLAPNDHLELPPLSLFRLPQYTRLRRPLCVSGQRTLRPDEVMEIHGLMVTTPLRTAYDLGRLLHRDQAIGGLDAMLRLAVFSKEELLAGVERFRKQRGVVQLRQLAPLADGRSESPGESTLRLRWLDLSDLPRPQPQIPVLDDSSTRVLYRLDLGVEELRFAAEYDGARWHSSDEDKDHDQARRTWLREERGWTIQVFGRDNVYGPRQDASRMLYEGIAEARHNLGRFRPGAA